MKKAPNPQLNRLRTVFEDSGLSNVEISGKLSCSPAYISKLKLQNDVRPRSAFLLSVAHAFNISEQWLISGAGPMRVSLDEKLKFYLESLSTSMDPNDIYIRSFLEKYVSLSSEEQTQFIQILSYLFKTN
ncbi:helix-turn-helix domain-containing protein [Waltera intestinalis]|uniref:Helix-turn-helix transcriptional regulator n=1 Tax=Waltera intestinalis TaxID=2606635 RepID=A0A6L5YLQ0_9FIRM|nr:helix-turn-helix transcriptional regulator [Waltera intestinalis]MST59265.1 helix-turn-helix transcriptional regulator [Waltera intestinalis]